MTIAKTIIGKDIKMEELAPDPVKLFLRERKERIDTYKGNEQRNRKK